MMDNVRGGPEAHSTDLHQKTVVRESSLQACQTILKVERASLQENTRVTLNGSAKAQN